LRLFDLEKIGCRGEASSAEAKKHAHPAALSRIGASRRQPVASLGVALFGQSGDIPDLYRTYGIDTDATANAALKREI
jgi:pyruvate dehydrogenase complex dehydrogenase (E1) component